MKQVTVKINDFDSEADWGLIYESSTIGDPVVKEHLIEVPGASKPYDATELLYGRPTYEQRPLALNFVKRCTSETHREAIVSKIRNDIAGRACDIERSTEPGYKWHGRPKVAMTQDLGKLIRLTISAEVDPYKTKDIQADGHWLWDDFCFLTDIIEPDLSAVTATPEGTAITYYGHGNCKTILRALSETSKTLSFNGIPVALKAGVVKDIDLDGNAQKVVTVVIKGTGTVSLSLREESL